MSNPIELTNRVDVERILRRTAADYSLATFNADRAMVDYHQKRMTTAYAELQKELQELGPEADWPLYERRERQRFQQDLLDSLAQLVRGPLPNDGVTPKLAPFVGMPGVQLCEDASKHLDSLHDEVVAASVFNPNAVGRYHLRSRAVTVRDAQEKERSVERHAKYWQQTPHGPRLVKPGDVFELRASQARSMGDMVEPVPDDTPLTEIPVPPAVADAWS